MGIKQRGVFETVRMEKEMKIMGMTTRTEIKVTNGVFSKRKVRLCARGDQQIEGLKFNQRDIYSPVLKSAEVRLMVAIAAQYKAKMYKTDSTQGVATTRKPSSTAMWRRTCTFELQTGGRSWSRRDTASSSKRIFTGHGRLPEHGISESPNRLRMDGVARISRCQQQEDYVYEMGRG